MSRERRPVDVPPAGLSPLAVLPVFFRLDGHRAVVSGGNAGAAWKAKLLAAAGADVHVFAPVPSAEATAAPAEAVAGTITLHPRVALPHDLEGAAIAISADDEACCAAAFVAAARAAGVPVNAVDRPELCQFQFGAIVNRSPLVVGISTDGAAPVFGQAVRSRIEAQLPAGIAAWAAAAKRWRAAVTERFATAASRRRFWERFADRALARPDERPDDAMRETIARSAETDAAAFRGSIALAGAGPGDPELLTLKAVRALRTADVVLYDDLVAPEILDFARREARMVLVGKRGHGPSCRQDEINATMVRLAREGKRVVRLKGGDPMIFGRASEEIAAARAAGIPVEVVPGITSAQGAASRLQTSLTHRAVARRVQFVTGHDREGELPEDVRGACLADPATTTVVYMPKRTLAALSARAIAAGLPPSTPAVAVFEATRAGERVVWATVATIASAVGDAAEDGPCLVVIGEAMADAGAATLAASAAA